MKPSVGKALDYAGAFVFLVGIVIAAWNGLILAMLASSFGVCAFACSAMVWTIRRDNGDDDLYVEDEGLFRGMCILFAIMSALLFIAAIPAWVIA